MKVILLTNFELDSEEMLIIKEKFEVNELEETGRYRITELNCFGYENDCQECINVRNGISIRHDSNIFIDYHHRYNLESKEDLSLSKIITYIDWYLKYLSKNKNQRYNVGKVKVVDSDTIEYYLYVEDE